jgi:hypothetical protein
MAHKAWPLTAAGAQPHNFHVKLHPVTQLLLFAIAARLAADAVLTAHLSELLARMPDLPGAPGLETRAVGGEMAELARTVLYLGLAATVEILSRWAHGLRAARWRRERSAP